MWTRRLFELVLVACVASLAPAAFAAPTPPATPTGSKVDPLAEYRERFKLGMDRYKAGAFAEAIGYWEPIYRELGEEKGYRLAYNIGVAYEELGDATHAGERLDAFLSRIATLRGQGEALGAVVTKEEADARTRLSRLDATKARLHIDAGDPPRAVQIDANEPRLSGFVARVPPGEHRVTFAPGTPQAETVVVDASAGQLVEVKPAAAAAPPPPPPATQPDAALPREAAPPPPPAVVALPRPLIRKETAHPFSPGFIATAGGIGVAAGVAAAILDDHAWSLRSRFETETPIPSGDRSSFDTARTSAYAALGTAVSLGVVTASLAAWYFLGRSERAVIVTPAGVAGTFR